MREEITNVRMAIAKSIGKMLTYESAEYTKEVVQFVRDQCKCVDSQRKKVRFLPSQFFVASSKIQLN